MSVKVGVMGCGGIAQFHLKGYQEVGAEIVGVADADKELADSTAEKYNSKVYYDYKDLLKIDEIEAVSICLPNYLHYQASVEAVKAGKAVLCEKPMTIKKEDAVKLVELVVEEQALFQAGYMKRYHPVMKRFKEWVPEIGSIESGLVHVYHPMPEWIWGPEGLGGTWFLEREKSGGGMLVHGGSHMIDLFRWACTEVEAVYAISRNKPGFDVDYMTSCMMHLSNGNSVFLETGWLPHEGSGVRDDGWNEYIELKGRKGIIKLVTTTWDKPQNGVPFVELYTEESGETIKYTAGSHNYFTLEIKDFLNTLEIGGESSVTVIDGYRVEEIIEAVYRSAETNKPVDINYRF